MGKVYRLLTELTGERREKKQISEVRLGSDGFGLGLCFGVSVVGAGEGGAEEFQGVSIRLW